MRVIKVGKGLIGISIAPKGTCWYERLGEGQRVDTLIGVTRHKLGRDYVLSLVLGRVKIAWIV